MMAEVQVGAQAYNLAFVANDALIASYQALDGSDTYMIRGRSATWTGNCRVVRQSDGMELTDCGSVSAAYDYVQGLIARQDAFGVFDFGEGTF